MESKFDWIKLSVLPIGPSAFAMFVSSNELRWWHSCGAVWLPRDVSMVPWVTSFTAKDLRLWQSGARFLQRLFVGFLVQPGKIYECLFDLFASLICVGCVQIWSNSLGKSWICSEPNSRNMDEYIIWCEYFLLVCRFVFPASLGRITKMSDFRIAVLCRALWLLVRTSGVGDPRWLWRLHTS